MTETPLNAQEIAILATMGVPFFTSKYTGETFINRRYFNAISQVQREVIGAVLQHLRKRAANAQ